MNKDKLLSAFLYTIFILITKIIYGKLFGPANVMIGIVMALGATIFMSKSFTIRPLYKATTFLVLNLALGVCAYLASLNIYLGLAINVITIFITTFSYMNEFTPPNSFIFLMGYLFMWATPVSLEELPIRLVSLVFGVLLITLLQLIFNRNALKKKSTPLLSKSIKNIIKELDDLNNGNYQTKESVNINNEIRTTMSLISSYAFRKFYSSLEGKLILSITLSLERLNVLINQMSKQDYDMNFSLELKKVLVHLSDFLDDKIDINTFTNCIDSFFNNYKSEKASYKIEFLEVLEILKHSITNVNTLDYKVLKIINNQVKVPREYTRISGFKRNLNFSSNIFIFSLKQALIISIAMFLCDYLNWSYGKWIVLTIYVVMQPYLEDCKMKSKKRLFGTLLGIILFYSLHALIQGVVPNSLILFVVFFIYFYNKDYMIKVMSLTVVSLIGVSASGNINVLTTTRFLNIIIGILIAIIINNYVLPYNIKDAIEDLKAKYDRVIGLIKSEVGKCRDGYFDEEKLIKSILLCNEIESKLLLNNKRSGDSSLEIFLFERNVILSDVRFLILHKSYYNRCNFDVLFNNNQIIDNLIDNIIQ